MTKFASLSTSNSLLSLGRPPDHIKPMQVVQKTILTGNQSILLNYFFEGIYHDAIAELKYRKPDVFSNIMNL
jgi:hypothetical protein